MIDEKDFNSMRKEILDYDVQRESLIKKSRDVLKLSKHVIYCVHRDELTQADKLINDMKAELKDLDNFVKKHPALFYEGSYKVAVQEYVEAVLFFSVINDGKLLKRSDLKVNTLYYLLGLCDLPGELARKGIVYATKGKFSEVYKIRDLVEEIYGYVSRLDARNGELRKKYDSIKYDLRRLDDVCFALKMKER